MTKKKNLFIASIMSLLFAVMFTSCLGDEKHAEYMILEDWDQVENCYFNNDEENFKIKLQDFKKDFSDYEVTNTYIILTKINTDFYEYDKANFYVELAKKTNASLDIISHSAFHSPEMNKAVYDIRDCFFKYQEIDFDNTIVSTKFITFVFFAFIFIIIIMAAFLTIVVVKYEKESENLEELGIYSQIMIDGIEKERKRISKEIHDTVIQDLKVIQLENEALSETTETEEEENHKQKIKLLTDSSIKKLRLLCSNLTPQESKTSMLTAITNIAHEFEEITKLQVNLKIQEDIHMGSFSTQENLHIIRIIQEALANVEAHSQASTVSFLIRNKETEVNNTIKRKLLIYILDNGIGFDTNIEKSKHFGLSNMRERANILNGKLEITSDIGEGTEILLEVPVNE